MIFPDTDYHPFFRLSLANYLDGTDGKCSLCGYKFKDLNDAIDRNIICTSVIPRTVACKGCFEKTQDKIE